MRKAALALVAGAALVVVIAVVRGADDPAEDAARKMLNERRGSFEGVAIGSTSEKVEARFGEPPSTSGFVPLEPKGVKGPYAFSVPGNATPSIMRYERVAFVLANDRVFGFVTSDEGTVLSKGVGVGDSLQAVRAKYPLSCREAYAGESLSGGSATYTLCRLQLKNGFVLTVTEDPVESIALLDLRPAR